MEDKVEYYVLGIDHESYGPADLATLNAWAREGRLSPDSVISISNVGCIRASELEGLDPTHLHQSAAAADRNHLDPTVYTEYHRPSPTPSTAGPIPAVSYVRSATILSWLAIVFSLLIVAPIPILPLAGILTAFAGRNLINQAERMGFTALGRVRALNTTAIILSCVLFVSNILLVIVALSTGVD